MISETPQESPFFTYAESAKKLVKAFVVYDTMKAADEDWILTSLMDDLTRRSRELDAKDSVRTFRKIVGKATNLFVIEADDRDRTGYFVILCSDYMDWEQVMMAYNAKRLTEQEFNVSKGEGRKFRTRGRGSMESRSLTSVTAHGSGSPRCLPTNSPILP